MIACMLSFGRTRYKDKPQIPATDRLPVASGLFRENEIRVVKGVCATPKSMFETQHPPRALSIYYFVPVSPHWK